MDEPDNSNGEGLDGAAYRVWAKRNNIHRKRYANMTDDQRKAANAQRRLMNDLIKDAERRDETRWDR